jgi:hypothetical protein
MNKLNRLAEQYEDLTGQVYYLYTSRPGDGQTRVCFTDGVEHSYRAGLRRMEAKLATVKDTGSAPPDHQR